MAKKGEWYQNQSDPFPNFIFLLCKKTAIWTQSHYTLVIFKGQPISSKLHFQVAPVKSLCIQLLLMFLYPLKIMYYTEMLKHFLEVADDKYMF